MYAGSVSNFSTGKVGSLFKTTNGGVTWDTLLKTLNVTDIDIHPTNPNIVFVISAVNALNPSRIYKTTNGGETWRHSDSGMTRLPWSGPYILEFNYAFPETMYASTAGDDGGAVYRSVNRGLFWTKLLPLNYFDGGASLITFNPKNSSEIFIGEGFLTRLFHSSNGGETWINKGSQKEKLNILGFHNNGRIYLGTSATITVSIVGLFFSDDTFKTWNHFNPGFTATTHVRRMIVTGDTIYLRGTDNLYRIINDTILYKFDIEGNKCREIAINGNNLYIGTENGVYRRDIVTSIKHEEKLIPSRAMLYQNYPNPFNANTIIKFSLIETGFTTIQLFDVLGRKIHTLFEQYTSKGNYSISFDKTAFNRYSTSGIYFYTLIQNGRTISTKKLLYIK